MNSPYSRQEDKDISIEDKLRALHELQSVVSEIDKIKTLRGELPLEVQDLEDDITGLKTRLVNLDDEIKNLDTAINIKKFFSELFALKMSNIGYNNFVFGIKKLMVLKVSGYKKVGTCRDCTI